MLQASLFADLNRVWGPFSVDAFATRLNRRMVPFWSRFPEPQAVVVDAFWQRWSGLCLYLAPPFVLLARVLREVRQQQPLSCTLLAPLWPTQA